MKTFEDIQEIDHTAQEEQVCTTIPPATLCNVSRGLLTLASSAIWLQAQIALDAQDDLRWITYDHKDVLETLKICLRVFEGREEGFISMGQDAGFPVVLPEPFLSAISDGCVSFLCIYAHMCTFLTHIFT